MTNRKHLWLALHTIVLVREQTGDIRVRLAAALVGGAMGALEAPPLFIAIAGTAPLTLSLLAGWLETRAARLLNRAIDRYYGR
jgi:hypothetical protein